MEKQEGQENKSFDDAREQIELLTQQLAMERSARENLRLENEHLRERLAGQRAFETAVVQRARAFRSLAENSPDLILRLDRDLRHLYVNPTLARLTGRQREDLIGRSVHELDFYQDFAKEVDLMAQLFETGEEARLEVSAKVFEDELHWFDVRLTPERNSSGQIESLLLVARDITIPREAQRELAYRAQLFDKVHDAIIATDEHLHITNWNRAAEELYGWKAEEVKGRYIYDVIPSEFSDPPPSVPLEAVNEDNSYRAELVQYTQQGQRLWVESHSMAIRDAAGQVVGYVTANRDITQSRLLLDEIIRHQNLLEVIFETDPSGIAVISIPDGTYQMVNNAYRGVLPDPDMEIIGKTMDAVWGEFAGFEGIDLIRPVLEEDASLMLEYVSRRYPNGEERSFTIHARPIEWKGQKAALLVTWETTELENALEEASRRAVEAEEGRSMLDALMEYIPEGITITSVPEDRVRYVSNYQAGFGGYQRQMLENLPFNEYIKHWDLYQPDGLTRLNRDEYLTLRAAQKGVVLQDEEVILHSDGRAANLLVNAGPIRDAEGRIFATVVAVRDITERKREESNQRFITELSRSLVALHLPQEILATVVLQLGQHLKVDHCFIAEPGQDGDLVQVDYHPRQAGLEGSFPHQLRPENLVRRLEQGKAVIVADTQHDPLTAESYQEQFHPNGVKALAVVPFASWNQAQPAVLVATCAHPRPWRQDEVNLMYAAADVARLSLEGAALFENLSEFRQRFEIALRNLPMLVFTTDRSQQVNWIFSPSAGLSAGPPADLPEEVRVQVENEVVRVMEESVLAEGNTLRQELQIRQGQVSRSYDLTVEPLRDSLGTIIGVTVASLETTEMRRMQAEVIQNQAQIEVQRKLISERELERTRIARELHDGPLQDLIAASFTLVEAMEINEKMLRMNKMRSIQGMLQEQIRELRRFCNELRPPALAPFGLEKTLRSHVEKLQQLYPNLQFNLDLQPDGRRLPDEARLTLFRVYQELMNNIVRHAQASQVTIRFIMAEDWATLEVEDDGQGFDVPLSWVELARQGHLGLVGLRERVEGLGGQVEYQSTAGSGTQVRVKVPAVLAEH